MIAFSDGLAGALSLAIEVETLAAMYWRALQVGEPSILSDTEMGVVLAKFEDYRTPQAGPKARAE
jgi:L-fuculose-phosphate aldolase